MPPVPATVPPVPATVPPVPATVPPVLATVPPVPWSCFFIIDSVLDSVFFIKCRKLLRKVSQTFLVKVSQVSQTALLKRKTSMLT